MTTYGSENAAQCNLQCLLMHPILVMDGRFVHFVILVRFLVVRLNFCGLTREVNSMLARLMERQLTIFVRNKVAVQLQSGVCKSRAVVPENGDSVLSSAGALGFVEAK